MNDQQIQRSIAIKNKYRAMGADSGKNDWDVSDYLSGMLGDMGDLSKLLMAKQNLRDIDGDLDAKIKHEIGDCLWSLIIICKELGIEPSEALEKTLTDLEDRLGLEKET